MGEISPADLADDVVYLGTIWDYVQAELSEALSADPDGPPSPLPGRVLPQRIVPPMPFSAYRVMLGE